MKDENKRLKLKKYFTLFELIWFVSLTLATIIVAIIYPEESANGVSGDAVSNKCFKNFCAVELTNSFSFLKIFF